MKIRTIAIIAYFALWCTNVFCQQRDTLITGQFTGNIEDFAKAIEAQSKYHFYFDITQFDSFKVNVSATREPLSAVMDKLFFNTDYYSAIYKSNVFLTRGSPVVTNFEAIQNVPNKKLSKKDSSTTLTASQVLRQNKIYEIGLPTNTFSPGKATITGYVTDAKTGDGVPHAVINVDNTGNNVETNLHGYYSILLSKGEHELNIRERGKKEVRRKILVYNDGELPIELMGDIITLQEVLISSKKNLYVNSTQLGLEKLTAKAIRQVPVVFGEADILRVVLTLPGVKSAGEASTGFNVRGGAADQNLILFNDAIIYNPSHFFGFFSAFNPELVKDVELYKSSIPEKYGGRLSSVLNVTGKEGNAKKYTGSAGIGLLTSRLNIEGPLKKDKSSFILGGRSTYSNWLLKMLPEKSGYKNSGASFYDVNLLTNHTINNKNTVGITAYYSKDKFNLNSDTLFGYSNVIGSVKWKHNFQKGFDNNFTAGFTKYQYNNSSSMNAVNAYQLSFDINQATVKSDFTYVLNNKHALNFGFSSLYYQLHPGNYVPVGKESLVAEDNIQQEQALESAVYVGDKFDATQALSISGGVRFSIYNYLGTHDVNFYAPEAPKDDNTLIETRSFKSGKIIKTYTTPEVRVSAKYSLSPTFSLKASFNTLAQYIHLLSNTTAISPTDIYKLSDVNIKPQTGNQYSFGIFKNFGGDSIETSVEVYYKQLDNYLDYKSGAQLILNHHIETDVIPTKGKAYGAELLIKKKAGKLNGWLSYTWSRTLLKMDDPTVSAPVNNGNFYPSAYDKPNDITLVGNYAINHRFSISLNITYSTGRPITLPIGRFYYGGSQRALYSDRNAYRIPDYFRSDFSMNIDGNHKIHQLTHNSWTIGIYNLTGRKNPYSVYYTSEDGVINAYKLSIFGNAIPFINYNIRF